MSISPRQSASNSLQRGLMAALVLLLPCALPAQSPQASSKSSHPAQTVAAYDVVSIVPNKADTNNSSFWTHDASFTATNVSLKALLSIAYDTRDDLISGLPGWAASDRFDINAKLVDPDPATLKALSREQRRTMLAQLLTERFQVRTHFETRILPVYDLVITKSGSKLKESPPEAQESNPGQPNTNHARGSWHSSDTEFTANAIPIASLADFLSGHWKRTVLDKTGLQGKYDMALRWAAEQVATNADDSGPSLFTALQEQLGLKLEPSKGPVQTLVLDHADLPSAN